jgi:hypothetical protein
MRSVSFLSEFGEGTVATLALLEAPTGRTMAKNPDSGRNEGVLRLHLSRLAWLPIPILFAAMAVLWATDLRTNGSEEAGS